MAVRALLYVDRVSRKGTGLRRVSLSRCYEVVHDLSIVVAGLNTFLSVTNFDDGRTQVIYFGLVRACR